MTKTDKLPRRPKPILASLGYKIATEFLSNWRLALLGLTGIVLSLASGWTTFDGIKNFTKTPLLSAMITFGIQGVMLVTAWLIGETFAVAAARPSNGSTARQILTPYARGLSTILRHLPLWVMFLTCMATSVFFSFDSLFSTIFPAEERARAGTLRTERQVAGIIADLETRMTERRGEITGAVLSGNDWQSYETKISRLTGLTREAADAIAEQKQADQRARQKEMAMRQASLSSARAKKNSLAEERSEIEADLSRLDAEKETREKELSTLEKERRDKAKDIALAEAEAKAELRGVADSGQAGEGPKYRALIKNVAKLNIEKSAIGSQIKTVRGSLLDLDNRRQYLRAKSTKLAQEIAKIDSGTSLPNQKGSDIVITGTATSNDTASSRNLDEALATFRQSPSAEKFAVLQSRCNSLLNRMAAIPALKDRTVDIDCTPEKANEAASRIFAITADLKHFRTTCSDENRFPTGTDALLEFARSCILVSRLPSEDTSAFREELGRVALNRDDRAHRFVVTWNAFTDGNRLAYLALAIAIAVDGLVFMSGLFGAAATVSPLSESPRAHNRTVSQLHEIIDNALSPDKAHASELALNVMQPISDPEDTGFIAAVDLSLLNVDQALLVRKTLTAGSSLGLVKHIEGEPNQFLVRSELFEYLSAVRARETRLGNHAAKPAQPKYVKEGGKTLPKIELKQPEPKQLEIEAPKPQLLEDKTTGHTLLDIEETRDRYIVELLARLELDHVDEELVQRLLPYEARLQSATKKWCRQDLQFNTHLNNLEGRLKDEIDRAHANIVDKWVSDPDRKYPLSQINRQSIWSAIILGETLPTIRDHLRRASDNIYADDDNAQEAVKASLDEIREALEDFMAGNDATPDSFVQRLSAFRYIG